MKKGAVGTRNQHLEEHQKAVADYTKALGLRPEYPEAYNNRGIACMYLGEYEKAVEDYN